MPRPDENHISPPEGELYAATGSLLTPASAESATTPSNPQGSGTRPALQEEIAASATPMAAASTLATRVPATTLPGTPQAPADSSHHMLRHEIRVWTRDLLIAIGLALVIIVFLYQPVKVEGTSMAPLLSDQERIFINKFVYRFEPIDRGDVVVFWYPLDKSKSFIKRVVGLPGETVEIRHGTVYINGQLVPEPYVPPQYADVSDYGPTKVPHGSYFVMGDHRISSNDSRVFGPVPSQFIYGRAVFAYWPVDHFGSLSTTEANEK